AEDGIRDFHVTGVQTCALPIFGRIETRNPTAPTSGTAAQNASASAQRFPAFEDTLLRVETALIYHFLKNWSAKVGYAFEMFEKRSEERRVGKAYRSRLSP